jgi:hypothetical protein
MISTVPCLERQPEERSGMTTHSGGCHCGGVRWQAEAEISQVLNCNCSICRKRGGLLHFMPEKDFRLEKGDDQLIDYQWNKHHIHHLFCATCGILSFARGAAPDGTRMIALNVRCIDAVDLQALKVVEFDGASL